MVAPTIPPQPSPEPSPSFTDLPANLAGSSSSPPSYFAKAGFATCAIGNQGHGFSDNLIAHIPDINPVVDDCIAFFDEFRSCFDPSLPSFLYSESLSGAIALLITLCCRNSPKMSHLQTEREL
ncbi:hypothetical protein Ahy_B03g062273 [Arachis hypogaea]|uniref:Serine aminopeptidase S33 domain-containing protein n=1 Tax=Arachis hypogaea TaxID=3818 RepID=A0A444ZTM9_ARAHY|nr:hypothetical protein Ahy_B03g062273 [Arachis hypogaea]